MQTTDSFHTRKSRWVYVIAGFILPILVGGIIIASSGYLKSLHSAEDPHDLIIEGRSSEEFVAVEFDNDFHAYKSRDPDDIRYIVSLLGEGYQYRSDTVVAGFSCFLHTKSGKRLEFAICIFSLDGDLIPEEIEVSPEKEIKEFRTLHTRRLKQPMPKFVQTVFEEYLSQFRTDHQKLKAQKTK